MYSEHTVDEQEKVARALKRIRKKYSKSSDRANLVNEIVEKIRLVLEEEGFEEEIDDMEDKVYFIKGADREEVKLPAGSRGVPTWAPDTVKNYRGLLPVSKAHYLGLVTINGNLTEAILDTAGSRTMIDSNTAKTLGLDVTWAGKEDVVGTFSGVCGSAKYAGVLKGPVELRFSDKVVLYLDEIKVFDYKEPLILIGDDLLGHAVRAPYTFCYVGVNPISKEGEVIFYAQESKKYIACELVHAPISHTSAHVMPKISRKVQFREPSQEAKTKAQSG